MRRAEIRWLVGGVSAACGLAALSGTGPTGDAIAMTTVLCVLVSGAAACTLGYRRHVHRIRREIEDREARGMGLLRRVDPPPAPPQLRPPACPASQRGHGRRCPVVRCGRGCRRRLIHK